MALTTLQRNLRKEYVEYLNATEDVDRSMITDCIKNYGIPEVDYRDKICLDLGANVGGFAKLAVDSGAYRVYSVECDSRNFLKMQTSFQNEEKVNVIHAAVSGSREDDMDIYKGQSKSNHCSTSIIKRTGRYQNYENVKNLNIKDLLHVCKPDIVKIDVEGAEYELIDDVLNYHPEFLFLELHMGKMKDLAQPTLDRLDALYSSSSVEPVIVFKSVAGYDCWYKK